MPPTLSCMRCKLRLVCVLTSPTVTYTVPSTCSGPCCSTAGLDSASASNRKSAWSLSCLIDSLMAASRVKESQQAVGRRGQLGPGLAMRAGRRAALIVSEGRTCKPRPAVHGTWPFHTCRAASWQPLPQCMLTRWMGRELQQVQHHAIAADFQRGLRIHHNPVVQPAGGPGAQQHDHQLLLLLACKEVTQAGGVASSCRVQGVGSS